LLAFLKVVLIGAERKTTLQNDIKNIVRVLAFLLGSFKDMKFESWRFRGNVGFWFYL